MSGRNGSGGSRRRWTKPAIVVVVGATVILTGIAVAALTPGGTFVDDDGNFHEPMIEAIAADGLTNGCAQNPARYCPSHDVLRSEMATFAIRAVDEEGNLPTYQGYFADVPMGAWYTPYVERLFELGITEGCSLNPRRFCPNDPVLRNEMAKFLVSLLEGDSSLPVYQAYFDDVASGQWFTPWVERLYELSVTTGCATGPLRFCPFDLVLRDQMASFLGRALELDPIAVPPRPLRSYGGSAIVADEFEPPTLNPFIPGGDNHIVRRIGQAYLAGVREIEAQTLEHVPELVTQLPTVANGGVVVNPDDTMTVTFQIRDEAVWSDGTPISGADFQFTLDTIVDPITPIDTTFYEDIVSSSYSAKTFSFTMSAPTPAHELMFDTILPKHAVEGSDFTADWNDVMWPSAGPFVFDRWNKGESITVVRNANYWKVDTATSHPLPYLDSVTFQFIPNTSDLIDAFIAREVDVITPPFSDATISALQASGADVQIKGGPIWEHINFQFGPGRLTRNPDSCNHLLDMRKAVAHTVDESLLATSIYGYDTSIDSYVDAFIPALSDGNWAVYDTDPTLAGTLHAQAETAAGGDCTVVFSTTSNNDARVQISQHLIDMFAASGIPYENQLEDSSVFFGETFDNGKWDLGEWAWLGEPDHAMLVARHDVFDPESPPPTGANYYRWGTPDSSVIDAATARFAELRDEMNATVDEAEIATLVSEAQAILSDNVVILPLYLRPVVGTVWADEIGGYELNTSMASDTWNVEFWFRTDLP